MKFLPLFLCTVVLATTAKADQTTTLGRGSVDWPNLSHPGGAPLETHIHDAVGLISDNLAGRYSAQSAIADLTTVTVTHNFGVALDELSVILYSGTHPNLTKVCHRTKHEDTCAGAGWGVAAGSSAKTEVDITTPASGGPHTFSAQVVHNGALGGAASTLQDAYDNGNTIATSGGNSLDVSGTVDGLDVALTGNGVAVLADTQSAHAVAAENTSATVATLKLKNTDSGGLVLDLKDSSDASLRLKVPTLSAAYDLNLPNAQGGADTFLKNDGSGNLSWAASTATSLQSAYEAGNSITTDATNGTFVVQGTEAIGLVSSGGTTVYTTDDTTTALTVTKTSSSSTGTALLVKSSSNQAGTTRMVVENESSGIGLDIQSAATNAGALRITNGIGGTGYTQIAAQTGTDQISWALPSSQGGANTYLKNDGSGNLSWGSAGGGGGGGFSWDEPDGFAPLKTNENGQNVYIYEDGSINYLVVFIKVPASKTVGTQSNLKVNIYSAETTNTLLLTATTYLIEPGDAVSSTAKSYNATNTAVTADSPADELREVTIDLTNGSGQIAANDVDPGDVIKIVLKRGSDTSTEDIKFVPNTTEVSF